MAKKTKDEVSQRRLGWFFLILWAIFITAGIVAKRVYDHADHMVFYHLPAAVFLVIGWYHLSTKVRARYRFILEQRRLAFEERQRKLGLN